MSHVTFPAAPNTTYYVVVRNMYCPKAYEMANQLSFSADRLADCSGNPANPANGRFGCAASTPVTLSCSATCDANFTGAPSSTCQASGNWSVVTGTCAAPCTGNPTNPANGAFACGAQTLNGSTCTAACSASYVGAPSATCLDGAGSAVTGTCVAACTGNPTNPANGAFTACGAQTLSGGTCRATCNSGFSGLPLATCSAGTLVVTGSCYATLGSCGYGTSIPVGQLAVITGPEDRRDALPSRLTDAPCSFECTSSDAPVVMYRLEPANYPRTINATTVGRTSADTVMAARVASVVGGEWGGIKAHVSQACTCTCLFATELRFELLLPFAAPGVCTIQSSLQ